MTEASNLDRINAYRTAQGLDPIGKFRPSRHQAFLNTIVEPWEKQQAFEAAKAAEAAKPKADEPAKATPAPKAEKPAAAATPKGASKKSQVYDMLAKKPTSLDDIAKALDISTTAARSLIGDLRRDSQTIKSHGKGVFSAS